MDPLDPAVLEATGAPAPAGNDVVTITPHDVDPAWSVVEYADGRTETLPTSEAATLPKLPPAPVLPTPGNVPFAEGMGPPDAELTAAPGGPFAPQTQESLVAGVQDAANGPGAGFQDLGVRVAPGEGPGELPAPQVDPGAAVVEPGVEGGSVPVGTKASTTVSTNETVADPEALAQGVAGAYNAEADLLDQNAQGRQDAANAENQALLEQNEARRQQVEDDLHRAAIHREEAQNVVDTIESTPIEQDFYHDSPGRQVSAWIALALSGFLQGATKGANPALNQMMQSLAAAQDRFIQNQRADRESKLNKRTRMLGDAAAAEASIRMQLGKLYDDHARIAAKQVGLDELPPAVSAAGAQMRVKAVEAQQTIGMFVQRRSDERFETERKARPGPTFQGDRELAAMGVDPKAHADAMDAKGGNLGGMVQGAERLKRISDELEAIAKKHGGALPSQNLISYSTVGGEKLAARMGSESAKDQVRTKQLLEEAKLAFKQTINIKSVDSENEGRNFNAMMDTGEASTTLQALRDKANETNQRAVATASGYSRNPQGYLQFIQRTMQANPGVQGGPGAAPKPKRSTGYRAEAPAEGGDTTGGGPAPGPLPPGEEKSPEARAPGANPGTASRPGTYIRLRDRKP